LLFFGWRFFRFSFNFVLNYSKADYYAKVVAPDVFNNKLTSLLMLLILLSFLCVVGIALRVLLSLSGEMKS